MRFSRFTFGVKILVALFLVGLADVLFFENDPGSTAGLFALASIATLLIAVPAIRKRREPVIALACAVVPGLALVDDPGPLACALFWCALTSAVLLYRCRFTDAMQLAWRLLVQGITGLAAPLRDFSRIARLPRLDLRNSMLSWAGALALPLAGTALFIALFASANPLIERALSDFGFPALDERFFPRLFFCAGAFALVWPALRPSRLATRPYFQQQKRPIDLPGVTALSVTISLALFNMIFAVENLLDIVFLWSGAALPGGVTMAEYAHRGAYPLIITALLAGIFVLLTANPQSELGQRKLIRCLVVFWIIQNIILVSSSIIRTVDYIDAYMLTRLRIAALIWMALVAAGLGLICWRIVARLSLRWLINSTALAAALVLSAVCVIDLGSVAAQWNIRHAREAGGSGQPLDLGYLHNLGPSAMVALATLETQLPNTEFRDRVSYVRGDIVRTSMWRQTIAYSWTWREARRLAQVQEILGPGAHSVRNANCAHESDGRLGACPEPIPSQFRLEAPQPSLAPSLTPLPV